MENSFSEVLNTKEDFLTFIEKQWEAIKMFKISILIVHSKN
jgi:hypothetical protein